MKNVIKTMKRKLYRIVNLWLSIGHKRQNFKKSPLTWIFQQKKASSWRKPPSPNKQKKNKRELQVCLKLHFKSQQITKREQIQNEYESHNITMTVN
jgi:hypothetical protein